MRLVAALRWSTEGMPMRENVVVRGIPFIWHTNLDDEGIRALYRHICADEDLLDLRLTTGNVFVDEVPLGEGSCSIRRMKDRMHAVYEDEDGRETYPGMHGEYLGPSEEEDMDRQLEEEEYEARSAQLQHQVESAAEEGRFEDATRIFLDRVDLDLEARDRGHALPWLSFWREGLELFTACPTAEGGLEFIRRWNHEPSAYLDLARAWYGAPDQDHETRLREMDRILRAGMSAFFRGHGFVREAILFCRRRKEYDLAISYCEIAIENELTDMTVSGFPGRLRRLQGEAERHREGMS
jgi:hypothetical protein